MSLMKFSFITSTALIFILLAGYASFRSSLVDRKAAVVGAKATLMNEYGFWREHGYFNTNKWYKAWRPERMQAQIAGTNYVCVIALEASFIHESGTLG